MARPYRAASRESATPYSLIGTAEQIGGELAERRERLGISYITVFEKDLTAMTEVMAVLKSRS